MVSTGRPFETARSIARRVRNGELDAAAVAERCFRGIRERNADLEAFVSLREDAVADAAGVRSRVGRRQLPLAGVPVAIKDILDVERMSTSCGSGGVRALPAESDTEAVRLLREAGAVIVGKTTLPELSIWGTTDGAWGVTRNPSAPDRTPGGSSGGSAAAVAAGLVPLALGTDGLGSVRIPAAACGIVGFKPGEGVVPGGIVGGDWHGMAVIGPLARDVGDAALAASVIAGRPDLAHADTDRPLLFALSTRTPLPGGTVDPRWADAALRLREPLERAGHRVVLDDPPYSPLHALPVFARWFGGVAAAADELGDRLAWRDLERRARTHIRIGRLIHAAGGPRDGLESRWRLAAAHFFDTYDVLITPALAHPPISARRWSRRSWLRNVLSNARYAPFAAAWNLAGTPAGVVPVGTHPDGTPLAVQVVAGLGQDARALAAMRVVERVAPER